MSELEKLSKKQREVIQGIYDMYGACIGKRPVDINRTEKALIRRGLLEIGADAWGICRLKVTPAGRCVVQLLREIAKLKQESDV